MKAPLTAEQITRLIGPQPKIEKIEAAPKKQFGWVRMTEDEKKRIIKFKQKNPTYSLDELSKKFGRSESAIWNLIKDCQGKSKKQSVAEIDSLQKG